MAYDYWTESVTVALHEAGVEATAAQIDDIVGSLEVSRENESLATGRDCIPHPMEAKVREQQAYRASDQKDHDRKVRDLNDEIERLHRDVRYWMGKANERGST